MGSSLEHIFWATDTNFPLILLQLINTGQDRNIFKVTNLEHLWIKFEHQKAKTYIPHCHRCQEFGHNQNCGPRFPRRVQCSLQHISHLGEEPRETAKTWAYCGGPHPANFWWCKAASHAKSAQQIHSRTSREKATWHEGRSYPQVAAESFR